MITLVSGLLCIEAGVAELPGNLKWLLTSALADASSLWKTGEAAIRPKSVAEMARDAATSLGVMHTAYDSIMRVFI